MGEMSFDFPPELRRWIDMRLAEGRYADAADYVRDLVRRDQEAAEEEAEWLRAMIDEGLASGVVDADPKDVIEQIIAERRAGRG
ncbi:MAG TPA: type II toxin-antitoxin system ParD family antitoxin [Sphingomonadaceae bacterium]|nr:type II toxin-antitoxin system ParD family antitoxin [Sphingomonadaceae bacterium]